MRYEARELLGLFGFAGVTNYWRKKVSVGATEESLTELDNLTWVELLGTKMNLKNQDRRQSMTSELWHKMEMGLNPKKSEKLSDQLKDTLNQESDIFQAEEIDDDKELAGFNKDEIAKHLIATLAATNGHAPEAKKERDDLESGKKEKDWRKRVSRNAKPIQTDYSCGR